MAQMVGTGLRVPEWMDLKIDHLTSAWGASKPDIMRVAIYRFLNELKTSDPNMLAALAKEEDREKFFEFHQDLIEIKKGTGEVEKGNMLVEGEEGFAEREDLFNQV